MRLLMLNNEFPPLGGGTGTVNQAMLQHFVRVPGLEIDLVTSALEKLPRKSLFRTRSSSTKFPFATKIFIIRQIES
jgi:hypothetical protein